MIKKLMTEAYEAPMVEVLDIAVEQGFASSGNIGGGGTYGDDDTNDNGGY